MPFALLRGQRPAFSIESPSLNLTELLVHLAEPWHAAAGHSIMDLSVLDRDPGRIIPLRWAASFTNPGRLCIHSRAIRCASAGAPPPSPQCLLRGSPDPPAARARVIAKPHSRDAVDRP